MLPSRLEEVFSKFQDAIKEEITAIKNDMGHKGIKKPIAVHSVRFIEQGGKDFLYDFETENIDKIIPIDTRVLYEIDSKSHYGQIELCNVDDNHFNIRFNEYIGKKYSGGVLKFDLTFLLEELSRALWDIKENPSEYNIPLVKKVIERKSTILRKNMIGEYELNASQREAIEKALGSDLLYIWGPPGTGKTTTLGVLAHEFATRGEKVIITSHTNVAVDTALNSVYRYLKKYNGSYKILRYGHFSTEKKRDIPGLDDTISKMILQDSPDLYRQIISYVNEILGGEISTSGTEGIDIRTLLNRAILEGRQSNIPQEKILEGEKLFAETEGYICKAIQEADVLGTTLTQLYTSKKLKKCFKKIDVAIVDEISIASFPQIINVAANTWNHLILVGDFNQLPPITQSDNPNVESQLGRNAFEYLGLDKPFEDFSERPILNVQYRMHPDICAIVNQMFYGGRLITDANIIQKVPTWREEYGGNGAVIILDTSKTGALNESVGGTRINRIHSEIIVSIIENIGKNASIGIITPYRGQRRVVKNLLNKKKELIKDRSIVVNTIHSFQGQERDVIILDLCDAPPIPPYFLDEMRERTLKMLLNVAISRAKKMLIILAHVDIFERYIPDRFVMKMLKIAKKWGTVIALEGKDECEKLFFDFNKEEWPPTKRLYDMSSLVMAVKKSLFLEWGGETYPIVSTIDINKNKVKINKNISGENKEIWIPIYEIEALKGKNGKKESVIG